jgi:hypothetical protein
VPQPARRRSRPALVLLERALLFAWLALVIPLETDGTVRLPDTVSLAAAPAWAFA